jgi:TM2 domain-containing membrane protein YozV
MNKCQFMNNSGECVRPGETSGPFCSFTEQDHERLCAVYPLHVARKGGRPMSAMEATITGFARGFAQGAEDKGILSDDSGSASPTAAKPKSRALAFLLCLFLGPFGVHRFYLARNKTAMVLWFLSFIVTLCTLNGLAHIRRAVITIDETWLVIQRRNVDWSWVLGPCLVAITTIVVLWWLADLLRIATGGLNHDGCMGGAQEAQDPRISEGESGRTDPNPTNQDDQTKAFFFCLTLGMFGAHRFYMARPKTAVVMWTMSMMLASWVWVRVATTGNIVTLIIQGPSTSEHGSGVAMGCVLLILLLVLWWLADLLRIATGELATPERGACLAKGAAGHGIARDESGSANRVPRNPASRAAAFLLCLFLGPFGVHRVYLGRYKTGILMFTVFGLAINQCMIGKYALGRSGRDSNEGDLLNLLYHTVVCVFALWAFVDLFRVAVGHLGDAPYHGNRAR